MYSRKLISTTIFSLVLITLIIFPACAGTNDSPVTTPAANTGSSPTVPETSVLESYVIADSTGDWGYPSPYAHYSRGPGYVRMQFVFETLVWKNGNSFVPQLASDWEYIGEDNAYIFKLQQNVKWHDGTAFTSDDVVFTYNYVEEHPYQWVDNSIVESVEALDEYTVKLYLSKPYAPFFQDVAGAQPVLPRHIWEGVEEPEKFLSEEAVIGTGPYKLVDYNKEQGTYLYEANNDYYPGEPLAQEIKFVKVSIQMAPSALTEGSVNSASIPADIKDEIESKGYTIISDPPSWNGKLTINHKKEPFSSKEFRQALAYAIDRESLAQIVFRGHALPGSPGIMPPTSVWYNKDIPRYEYDVEKAQQLISGLGYQLQDNVFVKDGKPLELQLIAAADYKDVGQFITQQLELAGITVDFQTLEGKTVDNKVEAWDFDLSIYGHGGIYEPSILTRTIIGQGFNSTRYDSNKELTDLLNAQLTEMDAEKRKEMVFKIQELYAEDIPSISLYYPKSYWGHDGEIELYYTMDGVAIGVPIPLNRMCFVKQ